MRHLLALFGLLLTSPILAANQVFAPVPTATPPVSFDIGYTAGVHKGTAGVMTGALELDAACSHQPRNAAATQRNARGRSESERARSGGEGTSLVLVGRRHATLNQGSVRGNIGGGGCYRFRATGNRPERIRGEYVDDSDSRTRGRVFFCGAHAWDAGHVPCWPRGARCSMKIEFRLLALTLLFPLVFPACTRRQVGSAPTADTYQFVAQGLCLTFVMDKMKKAMEPDSLFKDAVILSKSADARFRVKYQQTERAIADAKSLTLKDKAEKIQMNQLLSVLREESPDLIKKCDRLAEGFRKCERFQSDKGRLRSCLESENKQPMEEIVAFLNRDAAAGFKQ